MKKHLILFSVVFSVLTAFSQEVRTVTAPTAAAQRDSVTTPPFCPHRIHISLGGSITNNIFNRINNDYAHTNHSLGSILDIKYAYFFNEHWGISAGVGVGYYSTKATLNMNGEVRNYNDPAFSENAGVNTSYHLRYRSDNLVEKQRIWAIEVPIQANFEHKFGGRNGIYAGLGIKGYFPIAAKSIFDNSGTISTRGYEEFTGALYQDMPNHFGTTSYNGRTTKAKLRPSVDLQIDFGGIFTLNNRADLYVGLYSSLGFLNILPKDENKVDFLEPGEGGTMRVNPLMASNFLADYNASNAGNADFKSVREQWHLFQVGLKVGVHIKPCASNEPRMRDLKRRYYEDMVGKANDPIIIKNTEYVYIVPTCPDGYEEDENLSSADKENIKQLADALSNTKILFDLDKDIPKINDNNDNIRKTVEILRRDKSLGLVIEGYTCDLGTEAHNRDLAQRRAAAVRNIFVAQGVDPFQITLAAYTMNDPENRRNIPQAAREEHRAAIFRIIKR